MVIKFTVGISGYTEDFLVRIWEAQSDTPLAYVYETTLVEKNGAGVPTPGAGHQIPEPVTFNGADTVVHIVRIFGVVSGNEYTEFTQEPETPALNVFLPVRFKIGDGGPNTPPANQEFCTTPELAGLTIDDFIINRANYGPMYPGIGYQLTANPGEWELLGGDQFQPEEEFTIEIKPQITTIVNDSVVGKSFGGFVDINSNTNYDVSHLRKLIRLSGSPEYTFAASPPVGYLFAFQHFGSAGTAKINFNNGTLLWAGSPKTSIDVPRYSEMGFVWDGTNWNVVYICSSTFVNDTGGTPVPGTFLGMGILTIGDLPGGTNFYNIIHNLSITGDYYVMLSNKTISGQQLNNTRVGMTWEHDLADKPNRFIIALRELAGGTQNVSICWIIFKA